MTLYVWVSPDFAFAAQADGAMLQDFTMVYPGIRVYVSVKETYGKGGIVDLLSGASRVAPAYLPDLVLTTDEALEQIAALGLAQPLDALLHTAREPLFGNLRATGPGEAARLGVPFAMDFLLLAYRLPMTLPLSWDAIVADNGRYAFAAGDEETAAQLLLIQYMGLGNSPVDAEGKVSLDSRSLTRALEVYRGLADQGVLLPQATALDSGSEVWELYKGGGADFAAVPASQVRRDASALGDTGLGSLPTADGRPVALARVWAWAVVAPTPERQQAAARFLEWIFDPARQAAWCDGAGLVPTQPSAWPLARLSAANGESIRVLAQAATPYSSALRKPAVTSALHAALVQVIRGQLQPRQAADQALAKIKQQ